MTVCDLRDTADASAEEKTVSRADGTAVGRGRQVPELPTGGGRECRQKTAWGAACDLRLGKSEIGSSWLFGMGCPSASICAHPHPAPSTLRRPSAPHQASSAPYLQRPLRGVCRANCQQQEGMHTRLVERDPVPGPVEHTPGRERLAPRVARLVAAQPTSARLRTRDSRAHCTPAGDGRWCFFLPGG
jgi:hypothetical protein